MKTWFSQRPWMIIVIAQALFMIWWIGFVVFASHLPQHDIEPPPQGHARR
jgi:hypothetical protein